VTKRRARIYDGLALLAAIVIVSLDQWTKALVIAHLGPPGLGPQVSIVGQYLILYYIQNNGAAFSLFANSAVLIALIVAAVLMVVYLYARMLNSGSLAYKLIFGMIIGGAAGNLIDRAQHANNVTDFISFRIPQIGFYFAIFNIADAAISVGVVFLFLLLLFGGVRRAPATPPGTGGSDGKAMTGEEGGTGKVSRAGGETTANSQQRSTPLT
jgi:signal peptidase II